MTELQGQIIIALLRRILGILVHEGSNLSPEEWNGAADPTS